MIFYIEEIGDINCHSNPIAEINLYWKEETHSYSNRKTWLDVHFNAYTTGFINFCKNNLYKMSDEEIKELQKDFHQIQEIRGWVYEIYNVNKKLKESIEEYDESIYNDIYNYIKNILEPFCNKYSLKLFI